ncbi:efflux RND transporter periplasmic adaptor subunit [Idiomarina xiamenensis]|uniref:HlyD family secretion protein n=1 Tax=Idiomarina xiamenensis 10-D-4 TaxID=740709 RepID=K2KZ13_9GAMM|nr:efflux RND transporter periplasmic adaptor subunit [Idiomarina xiamenensis]EKE82970.1 HlyD family secretion protein [Idiomarina xiamenensis 10-D-4]
MPSQSSLKALGVIFCVASLASLTGCTQADAGNQKPQQVTELRIPVEVGNASQGDITQAYQTTATLEAREEADVISKVNGLVEEIYVEEGDAVSKGDVIARLRDDEYRIQLARAKAELAGIEQELKRVGQMAEQQLVSADVYDKLRAQRDVKQAEYDMAALNLSETEIRAPISGHVATRYVKVGNLVTQYQANALFYLVDQTRLQGIIHLPEQQLASIAIGQQASLRVASQADDIHGTVERISPVVDSRSGTFKVVLAVDNADQHLKSGMYAAVKLQYNTHRNATLIPQYAVVSLDNQHSVFRVDENGVAHKIDVHLGYSNDTHFEVLNGLNNGDKIVITGQNNLKDQAKVDIINAG